MSVGLDNILESIRENPDNANLISRYVQLATDGVSVQGVEAIVKLVDVFIEIYPKKALEIATSLLDYARTDGLPQSCEKLSMEKISQCFKVMGKSDEANEIEEEISKLFDSDLKATHLLTDDQNLDSFAANAEPESMLKKMAEIAEQVLQPTEYSSPHLPENSQSKSAEEIPEKTNVDPMPLGLDLGDLNAENSENHAETLYSQNNEDTVIETTHSHHRAKEISEIEDKNRANVKIHLPIDESKQVIKEQVEDSLKTDSVVAMSDRGLGPNLLTGSAEFLSNETRLDNVASDVIFWRDVLLAIEKYSLNTSESLSRYLSDIHKEHNCVLRDSTRDHLTKIFWNAYKAENFNITSEIFNNFNHEEIKCLFVALNKDQSFADVFEVFLLDLSRSGQFRKMHYFLNLYLTFDESLIWGRFIYSQFKKYWSATSQVGSKWEEKDGVRALFLELSKRSFPSLSKMSV